MSEEWKTALASIADDIWSGASQATVNAKMNEFSPKNIGQAAGVLTTPKGLQIPYFTAKSNTGFDVANIYDARGEKVSVRIQSGGNQAAPSSAGGNQAAPYQTKWNGQNLILAGGALLGIGILGYAILKMD